MPTYDFSCISCGAGFEQYLHLREAENPPCRSCSAPTERVWGLGVDHKGSDTYPYITRNLDPSGKPIEVKSASHLESLCKQFGVTHRPDAAWLTKEHAGFDIRTRKPKYKEGSGMGMPGCWV